MKKVLAWILGIIAALCIAVFCIWGGEIRTINTVSKVGDNPYLYKMEYKARYDLDDLVSKSIDSNAKLLDYVIGRIGKGIPIKMKSAQVADENGTVEDTQYSSVYDQSAGTLALRNWNDYDTTVQFKL